MAVDQHEYTHSHLSKHLAVVAVQPVSCLDYNDLCVDWSQAGGSAPSA